jgi:uncharacterized membrane protein
MSHSNKPKIHQNNPSNRKTVTFHATQSLLPPAEELQKLYDIDPKLVDTYRNFINNEQSHRHSMESSDKEIINREINLRYFGLFLLFILLLLFLVGSIVLILKGHVITGSIFGGTTISSIIAGFVTVIILKRKK